MENLNTQKDWYSKGIWCGDIHRFKYQHIDLWVFHACTISNRTSTSTSSWLLSVINISSKDGIFSTATLQRMNQICNYMYTHCDMIFITFNAQFIHRMIDRCPVSLMHDNVHCSTISPITLRNYKCSVTYSCRNLGMHAYPQNSFMFAEVLSSDELTDKYRSSITTAKTAKAQLSPV